MQKLRYLIPIALVGALAACGGGGSSDKLSSGDIAVVGHTHIAKAQFDALMEQARQSYKKQGQAFPKEGTTKFQTVKAEAVSLLVQQAEREEKANSMGIKVTDADIDKRLAQIKKQYFKGDETKYQAYLKQNKLTEAEVRDDVREQLISQDVFNKLTKNVKISNSDVSTYYKQNISQYQQQPSRVVRYILVKQRATAEQVYQQLKNGTDATWCKLAKKYAKDSSGQQCGRATFSKGQTVAVFDKIAFASPAHVVHVPFYDPTSYKSWFVVEPLGAVQKASVTPQSQVASQIRQTLLQAKKNQMMSNWLAGLKNSFCSGSRIKYQVGFVASPDPCAATTTATTG
jgi:peptidyl-prolyl cis-trans isomerase C